MYDPPGYLWAIAIAGIIAIPAATCGVLYGGAVRAGRSRRRAALLAGGAAVVLGGWFTGGGKPGVPCSVKYSTQRRRQCS